MTRKNPPARWVLPETVDPVARKCIQIQVPDDPAHIAAFRGALLALASGYNWSDDPTHKAKDVAKVWRDILDNSFDWGCDMKTQIRVDDICTLSWSYDDWVTFDSYDPSGCILANIDSVVPGMINQAILDAIQDGLIQGGNSQQSPQSPPAPGHCTTYHVHLSAQDRWLCPSPVNAGDTVTVQNVSGAWWDGDALSTAWYCIDGRRWLVLACSTIGEHTDSNDPLPSVSHMRLVGNVGSDWLDVIAGVAIPTGTTNAPLFIQANDGTLTDNQGNADFDVVVCTAEQGEAITLSANLVPGHIPEVAYVGTPFDVTLSYYAPYYNSICQFTFSRAVNVTYVSVDQPQYPLNGYRKVNGDQVYTDWATGTSYSNVTQITIESQAGVQIDFVCTFLITS